MDVAALAKQTGKTRNYIRMILSGKRRPGPEMAAELEKHTGINRIDWLYPETNKNPLIKRNDNGNS